MCGLCLRLCWRRALILKFSTAFRPGLYHYVRQGVGERSRIHLRIDPDESGLLMINANRVMHLNPTAAFMASLILEDTSERQAVRALIRRYQVSAEQARYDYAQFAEQLNELIRPNGACPIHDLDLEVAAPFSARPSAPYRMDLALTYRCNNDCAHCYNARPRQFPEINNKQWEIILDSLWDLGIPHVVFTGGEPTLRNDLPTLIAHAEHKGQITGLNTNARRLSDSGFLQQLLDAGLDHVRRRHRNELKRRVGVDSQDAASNGEVLRGRLHQRNAGHRIALHSSGPRYECLHVD